MKRLRIAAIVLILTSAAARASAQDLPVGWRLPTAKELSNDERRGSPTNFAKATADFNGDGVADEALILKSTRYSGEALWVRLSNRDDGFRWIELDEVKWGATYPNVDLAMGIDVATPGVHAYGCFDDSKDCTFGRISERPKLKLDDPSIHYFRFESAASIFFWSYKYGRFLRVWVSD
jgi:hypothetical protein